MSLCTVFMDKNNILMSCDSRSCTIIDGKKYALNNYTQKIVSIKGKLIFSGGDASLCDRILEEYENSWDDSLACLRDIAKEFTYYEIEKLQETEFNEQKTKCQFVIASFEEKKPSVYVLSHEPDNTEIDFEMLKPKVRKPLTFFTVGAKWLEAYKHIENNFTHQKSWKDNMFKSSLGIMGKAYEANTYEGMGGFLSVYHINKNNMVTLLKCSQIKDNNEILYLPEIALELDTVCNIAGGFPKKNFEIAKPRKFSANTLLNSKFAPKELKQTLSNNLPQYMPISNTEVWNKALRQVNSNTEEAKNLFSGLDYVRTADDTALGEALIHHAIKAGNVHEANKLSVDLAEKLTKAGQAVQAASIFKRLSPEGMLMYAQRTIGKANREIESNLGKLGKKVALTNEDTKFITEQMKKIQSMEDGRPKDIALAQVMQRIANKVPSKIGEKVAGLQRISMLLNPKTMERNVLGNVIFGAADNSSNVLGTGIDKLVSLKTGKRTVALPNLKIIGKGLKKGFNETIQDTKLGIDTSPTRLQYELPNKRIFKNSMLNKLDQTTKTGLMLGDRPFWQAHYDDVLGQQLRANNATEATQAMKDIAKQVADERTYQDVNVLTKMFTGVRKALNGGKDFGLGSVVMPFAKTPANIMMRAFEFTPGGIAKAVKEAIDGARTGIFNQRKFVDNLSRGITGSGAILAGYELAKHGVITGKSSPDKDVTDLERQAGKGSYAFKIGNTYQTYDWAQPMSLLMAIGADMYSKGKSKTDATQTALDAITSGGNTLFDQPLLQGVKNLVGNYNSKRGLVGNLVDTATSLPVQFTPTLLKQIAQLTDPYQRETYSPNYIENNVVNPIKAKLPLLSRTLPKKIDTFGNEVKAYQGKNNIFNVMFNPGFSTDYKPTETQKEIMRIYEKTGDTIQFPRVVPKSIIYKGKTIILLPKEFTMYQANLGKLTEQRFGAFMIGDMYKHSSDERKAKELQTIMTQANKQVKYQILKNRGYIK